MSAENMDEKIVFHLHEAIAKLTSENLLRVLSPASSEDQLLDVVDALDQLYATSFNLKLKVHKRSIKSFPNNPWFLYLYSSFLMSETSRNEKAFSLSKEAVVCAKDTNEDIEVFLRHFFIIAALLDARPEIESELLWLNLNFLGNESMILDVLTDNKEYFDGFVRDSVIFKNVRRLRDRAERHFRGNDKE